MRASGESRDGNEDVSFLVTDGRELALATECVDYIVALGLFGHIKADKFFDLSAKEQRDVLEVARTAGGRPVHLLEKDVWVVWTLAVMFGAPFGAHLVFKGGTSLSKAYKAIRRFSEDVDLTYDIHQLVPDLPSSDGDFIPSNRSQAKKLTDTVRDRLPLWVSEQALTEINRALEKDHLTATARAEGEKIYAIIPIRDGGLGGPVFINL